MDILVIVFIAAALFGLALLSASLWPIFSAWRLAHRRGLSVSFMEARSLAKFFELEDSFLDTCLQFKKIDPKISITDIVRHHMADGNSQNLLEEWKKIKASKAHVTFKSLVLYDLAGKDVDDLIQNENQEYELIIPNVEEQGLAAYYYCKFRIESDSAGWITPDLDEYKKIIADKIMLALLSGDLSDFEALSKFMLENYLNDEFWNNLCHGEIIEQKIRITRP